MDSESWEHSILWNFGYTATKKGCMKTLWILKGCNKNSSFHSHLASITNSSASHLQLQCDYATHPASQAIAKCWSQSSQPQEKHSEPSQSCRPGQLFRGGDIMVCSWKDPFETSCFFRAVYSLFTLLQLIWKRRDNTNVPTLPWIAWVIEDLVMTKKWTV